MLNEISNVTSSFNSLIWLFSDIYSFFREILSNMEPTIYFQIHMLHAINGQFPGFSEYRAIVSSPKFIKKTRRGKFIRIWKTLFVTVAMNQVKLVSVILFQFPYHTFFMTNMNHVLLSYAVQDIFEDYSSNNAKRGAA